MTIQLSDHFSYGRLIRFTVPSIVMMIFTSIYGVVDGIFVSNFVGKTPFAAVNLIMPACMLLGALGFMVGTGGSALVSKKLGEGRREEANGIFSMLILLSLVVSVLLSVAAIVFLRPIAVLLGAQGEMIDHCVVYGRILLITGFAFILQNEFQSFLVVAEKPQLGLVITVAAGLTNIVLDALFVGLFGWGLPGAAWATGISQLVGGVLPLAYFLSPKAKVLRLGRPAWDMRALVQTCLNGSSEMLTNLSLSLVNMLYNFQLIRFAGEDGVAAYGVIMYVNFIFISVFIGYSVGSAPVIGYHYGAQNHSELHGLLHKSLRLVGSASVFLTALALLLARPLSAVFVGYDEVLLEMTARGFSIYSIAFLFMGISIFASSFFTALNNGPVSAAISVLRTLLFQAVCILALPLLWGLDGIWLSIVAAELLGIVFSILLLVKMRPRYHY